MSEPGSVPILPVGPVSVGTRLWRYRGQIHVTALAKATFQLFHGTQMPVLEPIEVHHEERHRQDAPGLITAPCDTVPLLPRADVTFVGHGYAPRGGAQRVRVRLAMSRPREPDSSCADGPLLLDKALEIVGNRVVTGGWSNPQPALFNKVPITYDRALGGLSHPLNPAGIGVTPDARGRTHMPNIVHPAHTAMPVDPAGFAPIPMSWPSRARMFPDLDVRLAMRIIHLPDEVDLAHFHAAPYDQRIEFLRGDEWLILDRLHPRQDRFETRLPFVTGIARVHTRSGEEHALGMRADAIHIDGDAEICTVVFRGSFPVPSEDALRMIAISAGMEMRGVETFWPEVQWPRTLVVEAGAASPLRDHAVPSTEPSIHDEVPEVPGRAGHPFHATMVSEGTASVAADSPSPPTRVLSSTRMTGGTLILEPEKAPSTGAPFRVDSPATLGSAGVPGDDAETLAIGKPSPLHAPGKTIAQPARVDGTIGLDADTLVPQKRVDVEGPTEISAALGNRAALYAAAKLAAGREAKERQTQQGHHHISGVVPLSAWQTPDDEDEDEATHLMMTKPGISGETLAPESAERPTSGAPSSPSPRSRRPRARDK